MINRWGTAALAFAFLATPLAAQEPSLANSEPVEESAPSSEPLESEEELPESPEAEQPVDEFSEPTVDVTELEATLEELLPESAPPPPIISNILPIDTPAAIIINTREDAWSALKQYALFSQLSESFGVDPSPQALPLLPLGMNYGEDVQPWVGDGVAIALLPIPSIRTINPVERLVTVLPIKDAAAFFDFIPTLAEVRGALPEQHSYRTFPIWLWPSEFVPYEDYSWEEFPEDSELKEFPEPEPVELSPVSPSPSAYHQFEPPYIYFPDPDYSADGYTIPGYAIAHLGNYIVAADDIDSLRQWIEYQTQGGPTLTNNPSFEKTQNHPQAQNSLATVYGNLGQLLSFEFSNPFQGFGLPPIPRPSLSERAAVANLFSNVTFDALIYPEAQGMQFEAHLYTEGALPDLPPSPNADHSILGLIPAATYFMGSGYDISGFWDDVSSAFSINEVTGGLIETARSIVALATGLDLDAEILGWMDGEYSLFLFPSRSGLLNSFFPGVGLEAGVLLETSNRAAAETALTALDNVVGEEVALPAAIADHAVVNWQYDVNGDGLMDSVLAHTWLTDDTLAFTSGSGAMERLVVPAGFNSLSSHSTFRNATDSFPTPNNGYVYVNASSTLSFFYNLFGFNQTTDPWAVSLRSYFGTVRSLSLSTSSSAQQFQINALLGLAASEETATEEMIEEIAAENSEEKESAEEMEAVEPMGTE
ncbi:hypothetical protein N836_01495 [Leptolyngbya sp. Heron Island J]|uniref:DUF3352 domain-containing protein n=1 Tax=Leptolyngbya sp. Heron Island J TaxID=1385935 RepID=UPI0003B949FF|nr:DUF3352 domain-containing protein [Leptolyngbya sp. Heron Island J]ESA33470.1 hypothetical protein N836_01495 [Leptolyngbya sp. Heron Island J]